MEYMRGANFAGSSPPFLGLEWAAVGVDPERHSPQNDDDDVYYYNC